MTSRIVFVVIAVVFCMDLLSADNIHVRTKETNQGHHHQQQQHHHQHHHHRNGAGNRVKKSGNSHNNNYPSSHSHHQPHSQNPYVATYPDTPYQAILQMAAAAAPSTSSQYREKKPNIILILTDDQDVELGSLNFMPRTLRLIRDAGAEFRHAYTSTPMCCPARSSLLTGMYVHNHMVFTNNDNCSSPTWQATHETRSFATYLSNAGYRTGYFGKYLNKYNGSYIPPGWREWGGLIMNSKYYNYSINMNGKKIKHGFDYEKDYYPDLIANDSIAFLRQSKQQNQRKPIMLTMSFPAPHGPEDSAPKYSHLFFNVTTHHTPSYDHAPNPDKQWILRVTDPMKPVHKRFTDLLMTKRLQTLQSVDVAVERVYNELKALGELENTYIIYTSDHGYHLGQFGLIKGKSFPFEFDVRVPFLIRGPGIQPATVVDEVVLNIDLAPTFLDMGGVASTPTHMDGKSILPLLLGRHRNARNMWPDTFLIESSGRRETPEQIAEAKARLQAERLNKKLVNSTIVDDTTPKNSDMTSDVIDLDSHEDDFDELDDDFFDDEFDIDDLTEIEDEEIQQDQFDNNLPMGPYRNKIMRLKSECSDPAMLRDCVANQKWKCINVDGRWRKHKCKFHVQAEISKIPRESQNRNCACFTPDGVVYQTIKQEPKRIRKRNNQQYLSDFYRNRNKREIDMVSSIMDGNNEIYNNKIPTELIKLLDISKSIEHFENQLNNNSINHHRQNGHRTKREDITSTIHDPITVKILEFQKSLETLELEIKGSNTKCYVGSQNGRTNCTNIENGVNNDEKFWRKSKDHIDLLIKILKDKIYALKDIKKNLRHNKPNGVNYDSDVDEVEEDAEGDDILMIEEGKKQKKHKDNGDEEEGTLIDMNLFDTLVSNETTTAGGKTSTDSQLVNETAETTTTTSTARSVVVGNDITNNFKVNKEEEERIDPFHQQKRPAECYCTPEVDRAPTEKELAREARRKLKEERQRKKQRKRNKKARMEKECLSEKMNCFSHDNDHWKTAPLWNDEPFCFCMNANNNTYSCLRTINATHDFLYCEFTTGLITFYNLRIDPFETLNRASGLSGEERSYLHDTLNHLKNCRGRSCTLTKHHHQHPDMMHFQHHHQKPQLSPAVATKRKSSAIGSTGYMEYEGHPPPSKRRKLSKWVQHQQHSHANTNSAKRKLWHLQQQQQQRNSNNKFKPNNNSPSKQLQPGSSSSILFYPEAPTTPVKRKQQHQEFWTEKDLYI